MNVNIEIVSGLYSGRIFLREIPLVIGRGIGQSSGCLDLSEFDSQIMISHNHCKIEFSKGSFYLTDLESKNGTYLYQAGKLVLLPPKEPVLITKRDLFVVGELLLRFSPEDSD
ncbi:MAG: FHA domain-containing protein [Deltaproteobacteria bacterium]|nr:FHA domain-containing protein [Deltaproteobacteria bacterium]MCX7952734.1 FHA domain-containing protein [Deltaproteobacteria bacterium]